MILAGDIGGTHTRLALFETSGEIHIVTKKKYRSRDHESLEEIVRKFLEEENVSVAAACFGVAGAVRQGRCHATNLPWIVNSEHLMSELKIEKVRLLNDLEANAYGAKVLKPSEIGILNPGQKQPGNQALIAAGTGLGEAGIYWDGNDHHPFACEGGHTDFAPRNPDEMELLAYLKQKFNHVSFERVVSGPGIYSLYQFLIDTGRETPSPELEEEMQRRDPPIVISEYALLKKDKGCMHAIDWFVSLYGSEAGNLALKFLAIGGVYVGGGIAPHLLDNLKKGAFLAAFVDKGRFNDLLHSVPIYVILNDNAALLGAASVARNL